MYKHKLVYESMKRCLELEGKYTHVDNDASYYIERHPDCDRILNIFFEWSNGKTDWKHNFDFPAKPYRDMKDTWFCHRGFLKVWKSIEPHIADAIMDPKTTMIYIVGYSHGGAIAQLCHEYVCFHRPDIYVLSVAIGSPRVYWGPIRKNVSERFDGCYVIRNGRDLVTKLPPALFGFRDICDVVHVGGKGVGPIKDHFPERYLEILDREGL